MLNPSFSDPQMGMDQHLTCLFLVLTCLDHPMTGVPNVLIHTAPTLPTSCIFCSMRLSTGNKGSKSRLSTSNSDTTCMGYAAIPWYATHFIIGALATTNVQHDFERNVQSDIMNIDFSDVFTGSNVQFLPLSLLSRDLDTNF